MKQGSFLIPITTFSNSDVEHCKVNHSLCIDYSSLHSNPTYACNRARALHCLHATPCGNPRKVRRHNPSYRAKPFAVSLTRAKKKLGKKSLDVCTSSCLHRSECDFRFCHSIMHDPASIHPFVYTHTSRNVRSRYTHNLAY